MLTRISRIGSCVRGLEPMKSREVNGSKLRAMFNGGQNSSGTGDEIKG